MAKNPLAHMPVKVGAKKGGCYARGKVPSLTDGIIRGPGGPTEDRVDAKVSPQEAILPARTVQAIGGPAAVKALIERTNGGMPPESEVVDNGKYADGAVPGFFDDVRNALARPDTGLRQDANALSRAVGDFSGVSRRMPDIPAEDQAAYAAQKPTIAPLAAAAAPAAPDYSNEPNAPANTPAPLSAAARPAPAQEIARLPSPGADTQVGTQGPQMANLTSGYDDSVRQIANIRAMNNDVAKPERLATNGTNWEADEAARRRSFDNFVTRSTLQSGVRDAQRSGRRGEAAAAANALTSFNNQADAHEEKAGEFDRGMKALAEKSARDQEMEGVKSKNALAQVSLQGQNALATTGMQGQNALATEALRGRSMRDVAALNADSAKANREYVNPLDADLKRQQLQDAQIRSGLRDRLISASPEQQQAIARQIAGLDGKYQDRDGSEMVKARMGLVEGLAKAYNGSNGVPMGPDNKPISFEQFAAPALAAATGQQKAAPAAPTFEQYAEQIRARNKGQQLSDKQLQDAYSQRYGQ